MIQDNQMSSSDNFLSWLSKSKSAPVSSLIDFALFEFNHKNSMRFVLSREDSESLARLYSDTYIIQTPLMVREFGNSWNSFEETNESNFYLITISRNESICQKLHFAELEGDVGEVGKLLGYPICCSKAYAQLSQNQDQWMVELNNKSDLKFHQNNRFISSLGGVSPLGELFPCSLSCSEASALGEKALASLQRLGLEKLANNIRDNSKRTLFLTPFGGVSFERTSHNDKVINWS